MKRTSESAVGLHAYCVPCAEQIPEMEQRARVMGGVKRPKSSIRCCGCADTSYGPRLVVAAATRYQWCAGGSGGGCDGQRLAEQMKSGTHAQAAGPR